MHSRIAREYYATYYTQTTSGPPLASDVFSNFFLRRTDMRGGAFAERRELLQSVQLAARLPNCGHLLHVHCQRGSPLMRDTPRNTPLNSYICRRRTCGPTKLEISCGQASLKCDVVHATYYVATRLGSPPSPAFLRRILSRRTRLRGTERRDVLARYWCLTSQAPERDCFEPARGRRLPLTAKQLAAILCFT